MRTFAVIVYTLSQLARFAHGAEDPLGGILEDLLGGDGVNDGVDDRCPLIDPIDHSLYLPASRCNQFYECTNRHATILDCPRGLQFNIELQLCDWPNHVDSGTREE